jgi:hypothetical protein
MPNKAHIGFAGMGVLQRGLAGDALEAIWVGGALASGPENVG